MTLYVLCAYVFVILCNCIIHINVFIVVIFLLL